MKWMNRNSTFKAPRRKASHLSTMLLEQVSVFSWHKSCPVNAKGHFKEFSPNSITESIKAVYITGLSFQRHPLLNFSMFPALQCTLVINASLFHTQHNSNAIDAVSHMISLRCNSCFLLLYSIWC